VADRVVEDGEERLAIGPVFPMRLSAAVIPNLAYLFQVVILLGIVCAVVAELPEVGGVHFEVARQAGHAAHMLRAGGRWIDAGDDRRAGRGADRRGRAGLGVAQAALCKAIEVRRDGVRVAVAAKMWAVVFAGDPENVGQRLFRPHLAKGKGSQGGGREQHSSNFDLD